MPISPELAASAPSWLPSWMPSATWEFFDKAGAVANFLAIATPLWSVLIVMIAAAWARWRRKSDSALIALLTKQKEQLDKDLQEQVQATASAHRRLSDEESRSASAVLTQVRRELKDGNRELARRAFLHWAETEGSSMAELLFEQSKWALRHAAGTTRAVGFSAARCYATAAVALDAFHSDAEGLADDLTALARAEGHPSPPFKLALNFIQLHGAGASGKAEDIISAMRAVHESTTLNRRGRFHAALALLANAESVLVSNVGESAVPTLNCLSLRAEVEVHLGRLGDAFKTIQDAIAKRSGAKELGPNHVDTLQDRTELVCILRLLGRYEEALSKCVEVVERQAAHPDLGPQHPLTLSSRQYQAAILHDMGQFPEALKIVEEVVAIQSASFGLDEHETLTSRNTQATILMAMQRYDQALPILEDVVRRLVQKVEKGPDHPETLKCRTQLSRALQYSRRNAEALREIEDIVERQVSNPEIGPDHGDVLSSRHQQALILNALGRNAEALPILEDVVARKEAGAPPQTESIDTLNSRYLQALVLREMDRYEEGHAVIEKAIERAIANPAIGLSHPYAIRCVELRDSITARRRPHRL